MGDFNFGKRNQRGELLVNFAGELNMKITNTYFETYNTNKWTWISPKDTCHEIDYILTQNIPNMQSFKILNKLKFQSDHRLIQVTCHVGKGRKNRISSPKMYKIRYSEKIYEQHLKTRIEEVNKTLNIGSVQEIYNLIEKSIILAVEDENKSNKQPSVRKRSDKISDETKELIEKRETLNKKRNKTAREKIDHAEIRKLVRKKIRNDIKSYGEKIIKQIMSTTGSTRLIKKEIGYNTKSWIQKIENEDGITVTDRVKNCKIYNKILWKNVQQWRKNWTKKWWRGQ